MATLSEVLSQRTRLTPQFADWLHQLVADWQLVADLSFGDLVLWCRAAEGGWIAVAHVRPTTGQMVFFEDQVGRHADAGRVPRLDQAEAERRLVRRQHPEHDGQRSVREEAIPVVRDGQAIAVMTRHTNLVTMRTPGRLELTYLAAADALCRMVATGEFPQRATPSGARRSSPRVGDGVIRLDADGIVVYASPNAISAIHRLGYVGELIGGSLAQLVTDVISAHQPVDEGLAFVLTGRQPWRSEIEQESAGVSMRSIPLTESGHRVGAIILIRDISEVRRRERELMTKDATIREIHHRVKNNLQSVAALLRLQARRMPDEQARAALREAERRVGTIAMVHEMLSVGLDETVEFDSVADKAVRAVIDVTRGDQPIRWVREGGFGRMRAEDATALAMIVSELVTNAAEHGLHAVGGTVTVSPTRSVDANGTEILNVTISDDGVGLPPTGVGTRGLGSQIVQSLVQDLNGAITWEAGEPRGTVVRFHARLRRLPPSAY